MLICQTGAMFCFACINGRKCCFTEVSKTKKVVKYAEDFHKHEYFLDKANSKTILR